MEKSENKNVNYQVDVAWTAVSYSENVKNNEGQQFSVVKRFKEKLDIIFEPYPVGQIDLYLLGETREEEEKDGKTEIDYVYRYGVNAIIFEGEYDNAPGKQAFKQALERELDDNKDVRIKEVDSWEQRDPQLKI